MLKTRFFVRLRAMLNLLELSRHRNRRPRGDGGAATTLDNPLCVEFEYYANMRQPRAAPAPSAMPIIGLRGAVTRHSRHAGYRRRRQVLPVKRGHLVNCPVLA